jgi:hypothetical protein
MYNITISCGRVLLDTLRHVSNHEKIITARMHARGNDDVYNKTSDEMNRKNGEHDKRSNHSSHLIMSRFYNEHLSSSFQTSRTPLCLVISGVKMIQPHTIWCDCG